MADNKHVPQITSERPVTDMNEEQLARVEKFVEAGAPGASAIEPAVVQRMAELYLAGRTYTQISNMCRVNKDIVLYLSHKLDWFDHRLTYLEDLDKTMKTRMVEAKLMSQDFMLQMQHFFEKKIGRNIRRYLATDSEDVANEVNLKDVATYIKTMEALSKSVSGFQSEQKAPAVSLNLGDGVTMTKKDDNTVEITPKQKATGEILKQFADLRREEEKK